MSSDDFQSITFHEIKNSIGILKSTLALLEKKHPEISEFDYWFELKSEAEFLNNAIETYKQLTSNIFESSEIYVTSVTHKLKERLRALEDHYDFHVEITVADNLPSMYANEYRLKSILINLIKNSFEAMDGCGSIFLTVQKEDNYIRFDLQDFGGGITDEIAQKMYTPNFTTKKYGTGLGLSICRQFVTEMSGTLSHTCRQNEGTTFTVKIPIYLRQK